MRIRDWSSDVCSSDLKQVGVVKPRDDGGKGVSLSDFGRGSLAGGALGLLLGSGRGSGLLKVGGLAALGVMAYKAYGQWQEEKNGGAATTAGAAPAALTAPTESQANVLLSALVAAAKADGHVRSEEHTSELQSLMRISYAVLCL